MPFKRLLWVSALMIALALIFAACGGGSQAPAEEAPAAEAPTAEAPAAEAPTEAAEAPAAEAPAEEEAPLGASLIGDIEGPEIITNVDEYPTEFNEAPMLADMVAAGDLPPVEDRLPVAEDVLVIKPVHEIGKYGGTWRRGFTGPGDGQNGHRVAGGDRLLFWSSTEFPKETPNVAKSWDVSDDGTEITVNLRQGMKWSDGEPFTANDIMFWYEHMYQNSELVPVRSPFFNIDEGASLEMVDDYTIKFSFPEANSIFAEVLGSSINVFGGTGHLWQYGHGRFCPGPLPGTIPPRFRRPG